MTEPTGERSYVILLRAVITATTADDALQLADQLGQNLFDQRGVRAANLHQEPDLLPDDAPASAFDSDYDCDEDCPGCGDDTCWNHPDNPHYNGGEEDADADQEHTARIMAAQDDAPANPPETEARPDVEEEAAPEHCQVGDSSYCEDCTDTTCPRHPAPAPLDPLTQAIYDKLDAEYPSMVCTTSIADYVLLAKDCAAAVREAFVAECSPCDECASTTCRVKGLHPAKKNDDAPADPQAADVEELTACIKPALEECAALVVFTCDDDARRLAANVAAVLLKKYGHCITCREECQVDHRDCPGLHPRRQEDAPRVAGDVWPSDILAAALRPAKKDDDAK